MPFKRNLQRYAAELGELRALKELLLGENKLTGVTKELGELAALKVLDLHSNKLTTVPPELGGAVQVELI